MRTKQDTTVKAFTKVKRSTKYQRPNSEVSRYHGVNIPREVKGFAVCSHCGHTQFFTRNFEGHTCIICGRVL